MGPTRIKAWAAQRRPLAACLAIWLVCLTTTSASARTRTQRSGSEQEESSTQASVGLAPLLSMSGSDEAKFSRAAGQRASQVYSRRNSSENPNRLDESRTAAAATARPLETLGQFDDPINEVKKQRPADISLYQAIKGQNANGTRSGDEAARGLDRDFLSLFDELWKIKNTSLTALLKLDYFTNDTAQLEPADSAGGAADNEAPESEGAPGGASGGNGTSEWAQTNTQTANTTTNQEGGGGGGNSRNQKQQQRAQSGGLAGVAFRLTSWLAAVQRGAQVSLDGLCNHLARKLALVMGDKSPLGRGQQLQLVQQQQRLQQQRLLLEEEQRRRALAGQNATAKRTDIFENSDKPDKAEAPGEELAPNNTRVLTKRAAISETAAPAAAQQTGRPVSLRSCVALSSEEEAKCLLSERQISVTLNNSFPGTAKAIEDNCKLITGLFTSCWPEQLRQLRNSLSSWNESLLAHSDFALPGGLTALADAQQAARLGAPQAASNLVSCGLAPQMPQFLRDRVNWMLLNLCVDKKFRQDYVDNLRCLSTWNQEKAQQVCSHEYKRMQNYLASQAETGNAGLGAGFEWARGPNNQRTRQPAAPAAPPPSAPSPNLDNSNKPGNGGTAKTTSNGGGGDGSASASNQQNAMDEDTPGFGDTQMAANAPPRLVGSAAAPKAGHLSESELTDREVSSKMLCCMFDQFLRCVHKQAVRDCGRPGAQFVVNFMSRIGTDDMKYLCNSETKTTARGSSKTSGRRGGGGGSGGGGASSGAHESRSPFIEGHYCTDPRIQTGLFNNQLDRGNSGSAGGLAGGGGGPGTMNGGSKSSSSASNRNKLSDRTNINHDPTFFGSDRVVQSNAAAAAASAPVRSFNQVHVITALLITCMCRAGCALLLTNTHRLIDMIV